ncbi:M14 family metallopeptidase [Pseudoalteromonas sp. DL2-H2.2]|uniref:M14 metallopeptidase family protein n=1 Tax=Pseudoalteromonas sp. DL2-H2.2 TaxID=2908889 RepID=UPI001F393504|nr:M14 metallopeptidase family protein [Pseudoalteromonas sp. DL2-H2.2]MCF2911071.1 M14 family metallopeptidase [Pseudoalteromonas sp. DL2-H2.2]
MHRLLIVLCVLSLQLSARPLSFYFDDTSQFDPSIPKPHEVIGYDVGEWHVRPEQLVQYLNVLAEASPRVSIKTIGYSHERRPLVLLTITEQARQGNIEAVKNAHLAALEQPQPRKDAPAVVWLGYSVHGNEPSGSNTAMLVAYYLAAAQGEKIDALLRDTVILLDPSLNPDGLARFASWANSHRGAVLSSDPEHREHVERWPSGRTNHYWFDLNRDWLLLQHPESRARIAAFHDWKPNVLADFHEMGPNSSYFFQPGIPSRTHPLTPARNQSLTAAIGQFHADALDQAGQLYFTQESFDDFYYGKGSTYPDINGSVGILFEQASSRGHMQQTINGLLTFPQTIKNQLITSLSTLQGAAANRQALLDYQQHFYLSAEKEAKQQDYQGYVVSAGQDPYRLKQFVELLSQHQITVKQLEKALKIKDQQFKKGDLYIPLSQPQVRLIKAMFSEQTHFKDNTFYDVSGWTLPYAYDLDFARVTSSWGLKVSESGWQARSLAAQTPDDAAYAYAFSWQHYLAPKLLNRLLTDGIEARVALQPFTAKLTQGEQQFEAGTVVIPAGLQDLDKWRTVLAEQAVKLGIELKAISSGLTPEGIDLGSRRMMPLHKPQVLLVGGLGTSQYEVGEIWYHLDRHIGIAPSIIELDRLERVDLSRYSHLVLADGRYSALSKKAQAAIISWVQKGGVIWGHKRGAQWLIEHQLLKAEIISTKELRATFDTQGLRFKDKEQLAAQQRIAGAIFGTQLDLSHPLAFGFDNAMLPVFKNSAWVLQASEAPFRDVAVYQTQPLLAGYADERNVSQIAKSSALMADTYGKGVVIAMPDNPVFRGFWYGSSRLFNNALFFSQAIH